MEVTGLEAIAYSIPLRPKVARTTHGFWAVQVGGERVAVFVTLTDAHTFATWKATS